jgi:hypothetical protein
MTDKNNLWIYRSDLLNPSKKARVKLKTVIRLLNSKSERRYIYHANKNDMKARGTFYK